MPQPSIFMSATETEPEVELLVNHLIRKKAQSQTNWAAKVATAKYKPRTRRLGMPNTTPTAAAQTPPSSIAASKGMPSMRTKKL